MNYLFFLKKSSAVANLGKKKEALESGMYFAFHCKNTWNPEAQSLQKKLSGLTENSIVTEEAPWELKKKKSTSWTISFCESNENGPSSNTSKFYKRSPGSSFLFTQCFPKEIYKCINFVLVLKRTWRLWFLSDGYLKRKGNNSGCFSRIQ